MAKSNGTKTVSARVYNDSHWAVCFGELTPPKRLPGRPKAEPEHLFKIVAEKLPYESLSAVKKHLADQDFTAQGVYVAHDSMGCPRYIGRGDIFARLEKRKQAQPLELAYYSFYVVEDKKHEREIESLLIRATGFLLEFNDRKRRVGIGASDVKDFEAGTVFYERQYKKGRPSAKA